MVKWDLTFTPAVVGLLRGDLPCMHPGPARETPSSELTARSRGEAVAFKTPCIIYVLIKLTCIKFKFDQLTVLPQQSKSQSQGKSS